MKAKRLNLFMLIATMVLLLTGTFGCNGTEEAAPPTTTPAAVPAVTPATTLTTTPMAAPMATPAATMITVTDLAGREVTIPGEVDLAFGCSPIETMLIYMLAPDKLGGWNFAASDEILPAQYRDLPVVGGWFGTQSGNYEVFLSYAPDVIMGAGTGNVEELVAGFGGVPVVYFGGASVMADDHAASISLAGEVLGAQEQADKLLAFYNEALDTVKGRVSQIPEAERVRVYYAEGKIGLLTDPAGSAHSSLIEVCGGVNIADVSLKKGMGQAEVSLEQIINWNPDVVIIGRSAPATLRDTVIADASWQAVKAVQDGRVYVMPARPFAWFDGPPGPNQIIGIYWTAKMFYPELFEDIDLKAKAQEFCREFYHGTLTDEMYYEMVQK